MIYIKDEKTGVCVEDAGSRAPEVPDMLLLHADEAESILRGLLRWAWENGRAQIEWVDAEYDAWQNERSR